MMIIKNITQWSRYSEYFIGTGSLIFSLILCCVYKFIIADTPADYSKFFYYLVMSYPVFCLLRLTAYHLIKSKNSIYGWVCSLSDILFLTGFTFLLSVHFGTSAATFKSPTFLGYFVLIALHGLRFRPVQVFFMGGVAFLCWLSLIGLLTTGGINFSGAYIGYAVSEQMSVKTELVKLAILFIFTIITYVATVKARNLFTSVISTQALEETLSGAHQSIEIKTEVLGHMNQNLRGPIGGVINMSDALRRTDLSKQQARYVSAIEESSQALLSAVETMMDVTDTSPDEDGAPSKSDIKEVEFDLRGTVDAVVESFGVRARSKKIDLLVDFQPQSDFVISSSEKHVKKIMMNLLDNAIKFTQVGAITVKVNCEKIDSKTGCLSISVKDTGIGMGTEKIEQIRQRLKGQSKHSGSRGMGLIIAQMFLQSKGSSLNIESTPSNGTVVSFTVTVPARAYRKPLEPLLKNGVKLTDLQVLIVDDLESGVDILKTELKRLGVSTDMANNAQTACATINEAHIADKAYGLAIIDYAMPTTDGLKLVQIIRSQSELDNMKIIVLLATDDPSVVSLFSDLNVSAYLKKPYTREVLHQVIAKTMSDEV